MPPYSVSSLQHYEMEVKRDRRSISPVWYIVIAFFGAILVIVFFNYNLHRN